MQNIKSISLRSPTCFAMTLIACLSLAACGGGSSGTNTNNTTTQENGVENSSADASENTNTDNSQESNSTNTSASNEADAEVYLDPVNIRTELIPGFDDTGSEYKLLGYRIYADRILAMDVLATNVSNVVKTRGFCGADTYKGEEFVENTFSNFLGGAPLRPGDQMATTLFFRDISDPDQIDRADVNCFFYDLETKGNDPAVTYDFVEFTGPDTAGRILIKVQINNDTGDILEFARCDFSAMNGNEKVDNARIDFNLGKEILPGEAYADTGILIVDFDQFDSDNFDPEDLHCDYDVVTVSTSPPYTGN